MSDEDALLNAIAAHPEEDTPRLMFADWLDEHSQHIRAEFIRVQIEISRKEHLPRAVLNRYVALYKRNQELIDNHRAELLGPLAGLPSDVRIEFRRGFVSEMTSGLEHLCEWYDDIVAARPLPRVIVADDVHEILGVLGFSVDVTHYDGCEDVVATICTIPGRVSTASAERFDPRNWPRLQELDISGCQLGDVSFTTLLTRSSFPVLINIDLSENDLTDTAITSLVNSELPQQLTHLVLGGNDITDVGAIELAARWPTGEDDKLEHLNLRFTHIGQAGQRALLNRFGGRVDLF